MWDSGLCALGHDHLDHSPLPSTAGGQVREYRAKAQQPPL